jgi:Prenyltransferase and squalene oxidase repeat
VSWRLAALATTVALAAVVAVAAPRAGAVIVALRVESSEAPAPLFDGSLDAQPHAVDGNDGSGSHPCSGSPGATPASTATSALDDALRSAGISWRGNWNPSFHDFFIDRIGPYASQSPDRYWSMTVNGRFSAGGCLTQVAAGDSIRFFYGPLFGTAPPVKPESAGGPPNGPSGGAGSGEGKARLSRKALRRLAARAVRFLHGHRGLGVGWATLALSLRSGGSPALAAADLIGGDLNSQLPDGSLDHDVNSTALAVLALAGDRPRAARRAADWLAAIQLPNGGFGYRPGVAADIDTTGLASWGLALEKRRAPVQQAAAFIRSAQAPDGGFPASPGGASNAQSTGLATIGLRVSGLGPRQVLSDSGQGPLDYLSSLARRNGSIAYQRRSSPTPVWTTSQALLGLTTGARLLNWGHRRRRLNTLLRPRLRWRQRL